MEQYLSGKEYYSVPKTLDVIIEKYKYTNGCVCKYSCMKYKIVTPNPPPCIMPSSKINKIEESDGFITIPINIHNKQLGILILQGEYKPVDETLLSLLRMCMEMDERKVLFTRDTFLANVSHEIRTPLNGIIGYNQLLYNTRLNSTQKKYLHSMNQCSLQLMRVINDILDFSKLTNGKVNLSEDCFTLSDIQTIISNTISDQLVSRRQRCIWSLHHNLPKYIVADKSKIIQILINLISNSSKYSDKNTTIIVNVHKVEDMIEFSVKDHGRGILPENIQKLFNVFVQADDVNNMGTGLGLAICEKLVHLLGGNITVHSTIDIGSTFNFTVKYDTHKYLLERDISVLKNKHILMVGKRGTCINNIGEMLSNFDMLLTTCHSGLETLRQILCNKTMFVLGIVDVDMADMIALAEQIKEELPLFPLIAIGSSGTFLDSHFETYIKKPIDSIQLMDNIRKIIISSFHGSESDDSCDSCLSFSDSLDILVAEDNLSNQDLLITMLEKIGHTSVDVSNNGKEAIEKLKIKKYDALLLDIRMPVVDGYGVMEYLSSIDTHTPIVIITTASVSLANKHKCEKYGAKHFISKPIDMKHLKRVLLKL
jgi:CheY-like chemotaxis protein